LGIAGAKQELESEGWRIASWRIVSWRISGWRIANGKTGRGTTRAAGKKDCWFKVRGLD
jgi:hypothetical protein